MCGHKSGSICIWHGGTDVMPASTLSRPHKMLKAPIQPEMMTFKCTHTHTHTTPLRLLQKTRERQQEESQSKANTDNEQTEHTATLRCAPRAGLTPKHTEHSASKVGDLGRVVGCAEAELIGRADLEMDFAGR